MSAPLVALSPVAAVVSCSDTSAPVIKNVRLEKVSNTKASEVKTPDNLKDLIISEKKVVFSFDLDGLKKEDITDATVNSANDKEGTLDVTFGLNYSGKSGTFKIQKQQVQFSGFQVDKTSGDVEADIASEVSKIETAYDNKEPSKKLKLKIENWDPVLLKVIEKKANDKKDTDKTEFLGNTFDNFPIPSEGVIVKIQKFEIKDKIKDVTSKTLTLELIYEKDGKTAKPKPMTFNFELTSDATSLELIKIAIDTAYENGWFKLTKSTLSTAEVSDGSYILKEDNQAITNWKEIKETILVASGFSYEIDSFNNNDTSSKLAKNGEKIMSFKIKIKKTQSGGISSKNPDTELTTNLMKFSYKPSGSLK